MITYAEALKIVLDNTRQQPPKAYPLPALCGKVLAEDIDTPIPLPRFDNSAVDGYAVRCVDFVSATAENPIRLDVLRTVLAGETQTYPMISCRSIRTMTGAPVPDGADAVIMREEIESPDGLFLKRPPRKAENIRFKGEELPEGARIFEKSTLVTPPVLGTLSGIGVTEAKAYPPPGVLAVITGEEVRRGGVLKHGQIYDSIGLALKMALNNMGVNAAHIRFHTSGNPKRLRQQIKGNLLKYNIIITTGGVSVGDSDYVRRVNKELGVEERFWKVALKPGKPTYFGTAKRPDGADSLVFGLPGNPVSALVTFELFVKPAIRKMMGFTDPVPERQQAVLESDLNKRDGRLEFVRGYCREIVGVRHVTPVRGQDSHMLTGLAAANCLIIFPQDESAIGKGSKVDIIPLNWSH